MTYATAKAHADHLRAEATREARDPDYAARRDRERRKDALAAIVADCKANLPYAEEDCGTLTVTLDPSPVAGCEEDGWIKDAARLLAVLLGNGRTLVEVTGGKRYRVICEEVSA